MQKITTRINEGIRAKELRVIAEEGNLGVLSLREALKAAKDRGLDLIEISPEAQPPVAKIMDYGKFQYESKKKQRDIRAKTKGSGEIKSVQIKIGTSENDVAMKAKRADDWLSDGSRVKIELFLRGRSKYTEKTFQEARLQRILDLVSVPYKIVESLKQGPNGIYVLIEQDKSGK